MNTKALCITVLVFTMLIFWGNHYATQSDAQSKDDCKKCNCEIVVDHKKMSGLDPQTIKKESCSLVFRKENGKFVTENLVDAKPSSPKVFSSCGVTVFCGQSRWGYVSCNNARTIFQVYSNTKCSLYCMPGGKTASSCEIWRRRPKDPPPKEPLGMRTPSRIFPALTTISNPFLTSFLPAKYSEVTADDEEMREIITYSARWRLLDAEAGFDKGIFTVTAGQAEIRSYCTGDTIRLAGPSVISLPTCPVDISGRWQGVYTRRLPLETGPPVAFSLELRNESGALKGELKTADGIFNIVSARQNNTNFQLEADGSVAGQPRKIILNGKLTKGDIVFDGSESGVGEKPLKLLGAVRRMYIADGAVLPAVLNQPYKFALTAVSPDAEAVTFRLAGGRLPPGISFDTSSGTFSGTPTEPGIFNIRVGANDPVGNVFEQPLTFTVKKMMITTRLLPDAFFGMAYSATLKVAGGQPPYRFSGFPPKGLTLDPNTGEISGIPTSNRHESSPFTVRDSQNNSESQDVILEVRRTTILTSHFLPEARLGSAYRTQFQIVGNNLPARWSISGGLDITSIGLKLNPETGELSGTPTKPGEFLLSVLAKTTSADEQYRNFSLAVKPAGQ